jgi:hypothetical protein
MAYADYPDNTGDFPDESIRQALWGATAFYPKSFEINRQIGSDE